MRIALINAPASAYDKSTIPPMGLLHLSAFLESHGHEVKIVDVAATRMGLDEVIREVGDFDPGLIGTGALITAYAYVIKVTQALRKAFPRTPQIVGGQVAVNNIGNCFNHMPIDYLVTGYGEFPLWKLVRHLEGDLAVEDIPGLIYRTAEEATINPGMEYFAHLDDMPLPAYHLIDMEYYVNAHGMLPAFQKYLKRKGIPGFKPRFSTVMGTLGCTDKCSFCIHEQEFVGLKIYSNAYLIRHIRHLVETFDVNVLGIGEEMFITKLSRAKEFNELMMQHFPNVYWYGSTRANHVTPEIVKELEKGTCYRLAYGVESGSQKMLDIMQKRISRAQNIRAYVALRDSALVATGTMMIGNVGEDNDTVKDTLKFTRETHMGPAGAFFASAFPGGRIWDWALERGIITDTHEYLLRASQTNHVGHINSNLTPYPDWILRAWQALIIWEQTKQAYKYGGDSSPFAQVTPARKRYMMFRVWLRTTRKSIKVPVSALRWGVGLYFVYYKFTRLFFKTAKDRQYEFKVDGKGALLPDNLIVGKPQRYLNDEKLEALKETPCAKVQLMTQRILSDLPGAGIDG